jgi:4-amino-4-deoxy-L-arabinose transferase-like glycosyltransferase
MVLAPILLVLVAVPVVAGVLRRDAQRPDWLAVAGAAVVGVGFAVLAMTTHDPDVSVGAAVTGVLLAGILGALPAYALFALGRALARRPVALSVVCVALLVPLAYLNAFGWWMVLDHVRCPPDAYECPF